MVNKKLLIGIIAIIVIIGAVATYFVIDSYKIQYQNTQLSDTCSMDIPISNNLTNSTVANYVNVLRDNQHGVIIAYYNTGGSLIANILTDVAEFAGMKELYQSGSEQISIDGQTVWYNDTTGYYATFLSNDTTGDNILIVTIDQTVMEHLISSVKYNS